MNFSGAPFSNYVVYFKHTIWIMYSKNYSGLKKKKKKKNCKHKPPSSQVPAGTSVTHKCSFLFMFLTPTCIYVCSWNPSPSSLKNSLSKNAAENGTLLHFCRSVFSPAVQTGSKLQAEDCQENCMVQNLLPLLPFESACLLLHSLEAQQCAFADATQSDEPAFSQV